MKNPRRKQIIEKLSKQLTERYGRGFSITNLRYFRTFYTTFSDRKPEIRQIASGEFESSGKRLTQSNVLDDLAIAVAQVDCVRGFSPNLSWSHYQILMGVNNRNERIFYEIEAEKEGLYLPTEEELQVELERERRMIEARWVDI